MKKYFCLLILLLTFITKVNASELLPLELIKCESSEEYVVRINEKNIKVKLLNYARKDTLINKEIDDYACNLIKNSSNPKIDLLDNKQDKYNRTLVNVYLNEKTLQEELISLGYGEVSNVSKKYSNLDHLCKVEKNAILEKMGIWKYLGEEDFCKNNIINEIDNKDNVINEIKIEPLKNKYLIIFLSITIILLECTLLIKNRI